MVGTLVQKAMISSGVPGLMSPIEVQWRKPFKL